MSFSEASHLTEEMRNQARAQWHSRLREVVDNVTAWSQEMGWSTREIAKTLEDSELGKQIVPALLMQQETVRVLLDPIARLAPGAEGVVDLYLLAASVNIPPREWHWSVSYLR